MYKEIHKQAQLEEVGQRQSVSSEPSRANKVNQRILETVNTAETVQVAETPNLNCEHQPNTITHCLHRHVGSAQLSSAQVVLQEDAPAYMWDSKPH